MNAQSSDGENRYWVIGGRWVDDAAHLPWPRVYGPFRDYQTARTTAQAWSRGGDARVRYVVVSDVRDETDH